MQSNWACTRPHTSLPVASDRDLCARLQRRETAALACLYDRYAPFVFTLLCDAAPEAAASLLENVFVELWHRGATTGHTNLLPTLLHLTAEAVAQQRAVQGQTTGAVWGRPLLPALAPFSRLPEGVFDVLVLTCLDRLTCSELAVALECDPSAIYRRLSTGLETVRAERGMGQISVDVPVQGVELAGVPIK